MQFMGTRSQEDTYKKLLCNRSCYTHRSYSVFLLVIPLYLPFSISDVDTCCCGFQMLPTGNFYQGPPGPNMQNIHPAGVPGEMILFGCVPPVPLQALASAVANANPELKRIVSFFFCVDFNKFGLSCNFVMRTKCHSNSLVNGFCSCLVKVYTL